MTIDNWLTIAVIISTLIAPVLPLFVQRFMNHLQRASEKNQPQNLGGRFLRSLWLPSFPLLGVVVDIYILHKAISGAAPITRGSVLIISGAAAGIVSCLASANGILSEQNISRQTDALMKLTHMIRQLNQMIDLLQDQIKTLDIRIDSLEHTQLSLSESAKPPKPALRKLLAGTIKNLFR